MDLLLEHDVAGRSGPSTAPVVLVHSGVCDRRMWEPQWLSLVERFFVVRCDLRGFGATPLPPEEFSHSADLARLLDHLGIERAALLGSSLGGRVALEWASSYPERVVKLALLCPALGDFAPTADVERFGAREEELLERGDIEGATELNVETWLGPEATPDTRDLVRAMQRHAFEIQMAAGEPTIAPVEVEPGRITATTLLVSGSKDLEFFRKVALHLSHAIPRARHVELDWAGHLPSLERPGEITELLLDFLSAADAPCPSS